MTSTQKLDSFFLLDQPFQSFSDLSQSDLVFKNLSEIPIVDEDVKFRLATNLRDMLLDLNTNVVKKLRRSGKLKDN